MLTHPHRLGKPPRPLPSRDKQGGVFLLEALVALLIFSMGILAVIGLQAASIRNTTESKMRVEASYLANQTLGTMWVDRTNLASYAGTTTIASLPQGQQTVAVNGTQVTITITWKTANGPAHSYSTITQINGTT